MIKMPLRVPGELSCGIFGVVKVQITTYLLGTFTDDRSDIFCFDGSDGAPHKTSRSRDLDYAARR